MNKIGFLGPLGTFSEEAALVYTGGSTEGLVAYPDIYTLMVDVDNRVLDKGIVPIENALEGTVNLTVDMLVHEVDVGIAGEIVLPISHCLMVRPGVSPEDVRVILSHPQALAQCRKYLKRFLPQAKVITSSSTSSGAKAVCETEEPWGAIGNRRAAEVFGLDIIDKDIQDQNGNSTRFIVISKDYKPGASGCDKTSVAFTVDDSPGSLLSALNIFASHNINLKKIESRPMRTLLGQYLFLIDLEGHIEDDIVKKSIELLAKSCSFFKFLGSYPV